MSSESLSPFFDTDQEQDAALLRMAEGLVFLRPLVPYPGWRFDADWDSPDLAFRLRRRIWSHFRDRGAAAPLRMPWYNGTQILLHLGNDLSKQVFVGGCNEPNELALLGEVLRPGMVFVDAGANEGAFSVLAASRVGPSGSVLAFEPSEREFGRLKRNLDLNGLANVAAYRTALSDRSGQVELLVADSEHSGQNTLGEFVHRDVGVLRREWVELRTLEEIVNDSGLNRVDVMKIDVEGAEAHVLRGSTKVLREMRPLVMFEVLEEAMARQGSSVDELRRIFSSVDYFLFGFDEATGRPAPLNAEKYAGNLLAAPAEARFPDHLYESIDLPSRLSSFPPSRPSATSVVPSGQESAASCGEDSAEPYLSVVVASRNDDHGGSMLRRMQTFVNAFINQCRRHSLPTELIFVEWNPPPNRLPLAEAIRWPADLGPCRVRIIEAPPEIHRRYAHAENLPLYQMIAKNAGIRRARGRFVLATNIDVLFNDELMRFITAGRLRSDRMYRIDRHDAMTDVPVDGSVEAQLEYCRTHLVRIHAREGTFPLTPDGELIQPPPEEAPPEEVPAEKPAPASPPPDGAVEFVAGWHPIEQHFGEAFRWAEEVALVRTGRPPAGRSTLVLELEPGPSAGARPLVLQIFDGSDRLLGEAKLEGRALLNVTPADEGGHATLHFHACGCGVVAPNDYRVLAFRVLRYEWAERRADGPGAVEAHARDRRWRLASWRRRWSRLWRSLWWWEGPVRLGLPFSAALVRALGLRIDPSGIAIDLGVKPLPAPMPPEPPPPPVEATATPPVVHAPSLPHTNACGDFTLLAREKWLALRGYPEFDAYSFNIDSIFCLAAHFAGVTEEILEDPMRVYHIEHGLGSGWSPEGQAQLFERLAASGIPYIDWPEVAGWARQMRRLGCPIIFSDDNWGLAEFDLRETVISSEPAGPR